MSEAFDNAQAIAEGWDLFEVDKRIQLQRIDCPSDHGDMLPYSEPMFVSDADAIIHVALRAHAGSDYHRDALMRVGCLAEDCL